MELQLIVLVFGAAGPNPGVHAHGRLVEGFSSPGQYSLCPRCKSRQSFLPLLTTWHFVAGFNPSTVKDQVEH